MPCYMITFIWHWSIGKVTEKKADWWLPGGCGEGRRKMDCKWGATQLCGSDATVLYCDCSGGDVTVYYYQNSSKCAF